MSDLVRRQDVIDAIVELTGRDSREQLERDVERIKESMGMIDGWFTGILDAILAVDDVEVIRNGMDTD